MAEATSVSACIDRHTAYPFDIAGRLKPFQRQRIADMISGVRSGETVLDVGCNSGYLVDFLPSGCVGWGVDVASELVARAATRMDVVAIAPAERLPFPDRSVDVVVLGEILEHVYNPIAVLREAARVARRMVVGSTPHELSAWGPGQGRGPEGHRFHVRCYTMATLSDALLSSGVFTDWSVGRILWSGAPMFYRFEARCACA